MELVLVLAMHENPSHSVFMKTVEEIRSAEEKSDKTLTSAKEKADKILRKAKEEIADENAAAQDELTKYKNERLKEGKAEIDKEVQKTLDKAKDNAAGIRKKQLDKRTTLALCKSFISKL